MRLGARARGFTLIELMVTVVVSGILLAVAVPSLTSLFDRNRVKGAAEEFATALRLARSEAMLANKPIFLAVQTGSAWCYGFSDAATGCDCTVSNACTVRGQDRHTSGKDLTLISMTANTTMTAATISRQGVVTGNGRVEFVSGGATTRVAVSPVGRTSMCASNFAGWPPLSNC